MRRIWPSFETEPLDQAALLTSYYRSDQPRVRVNMVMGLDGAFVVAGAATPLSSREDRALLQLLRMQTDVLLIGAETLRAENVPPLRLDPEQVRWRVENGLPEHPTLAIVTGSLDLSPDHRALADAPVRPLIITVEHSPADRRATLAARADIVAVGEALVDPALAVQVLADRGLTQVLCEGGPTLLSSFIAADLVDEMCLTLSPSLAGAGVGRMTRGVPAPELRRLVPRHIALADDGLIYLRYTRPGPQDRER